jgi:hypothetical protein
MKTNTVASGFVTNHSLLQLGDALLCCRVEEEQSIKNALIR